MKTPSNAIGFAQLGCGRVAEHYLDFFTQGAIQGAKLVSVCDIDAGRASAFAARSGAEAFGSRDALLAETKADVICISTPSGNHADDIRAILESGRHCIVEKPVTLRVEDALLLDELAAIKGVMLTVVKQNRYNPAMQKLKQTMAKGRFGRLVAGTVRVRWARDMDYYLNDAWRGRFASDGGCIANQGIHHIDALQWIMGPIEAVCASGTARLNDIEVDDTTVATVRFKSGALGVIEVTTAARPNDFEASLSILGEGGTVVVGGLALNQIETWEFVQKESEDAMVPQAHSQQIPNAYGLGHIPLLQEVTQRLLAGSTQAPITAREGSVSIGIVHALYRSMETNGWIYMDGDYFSRRLGIGADGV